jgi:hypothetical protein
VEGLARSSAKMAKMETLDTQGTRRIEHVRIVELDAKTTYSYEVVEQKFSNGRLCKLVKIALPPVSTRMRRRILEGFLDGTKALGMIEWWARGSLARRPWRNFYVIIILARH